MITKPNVVKEAITPPISKKNIDTVNKKQKSQESNKTVDTPKINKSEKVKSLYKSRYTIITDTENMVKKVNKSRSISRIILYKKSTRIEPPPRNVYLKRQFKSLCFVWTWRKFIKCKTRLTTHFSQE